MVEVDKIVMYCPFIPGGGQLKEKYVNAGCGWFKTAHREFVVVASSYEVDAVTELSPTLTSTFLK
jgi:hypothetical protein